MNQEIYNIEKNYLKRIQARLHKLINTISDLDRNLSNTELQELIVLNNNISQLDNDISIIELNILKNIPNRKLSYSIKKKIEESQHADKVINKFLPYMLLYSINN